MKSKVAIAICFIVALFISSLSVYASSFAEEKYPDRGQSGKIYCILDGGGCVISGGDQTLQ